MLLGRREREAHLGHEWVDVGILVGPNVGVDMTVSAIGRSTDLQIEEYTYYREMRTSVSL